MKKLLLILSAILILGCSKNRVLQQELSRVYLNSRNIQYFNGEPFSGIAFNLYSNGHLEFEATYKDGVLDGLYKEWCLNGELLKKGKYKKGNPAEWSSIHAPAGEPDEYEYGIWETWYCNSNAMSSEKEYYNGSLHGFSKEWYEDGQLSKEGEWKEDSREGLHKSYYSNGQLLTEGEWKDGLREGLHKSYYSNGQLRSETIYKDGYKNDTVRNWFENGQLESEWNFVQIEVNRWEGEYFMKYKVLKDGISKGWDQHGKLQYELTYKFGQKDGISKGWYPTGKLYYEHNYKNDKLDGLCKAWHKNGQLLYEQNYKDGYKWGLFKRWWDDGELRSEDTYDKTSYIGHPKWKNYRYSYSNYKKNWIESIEWTVEKAKRIVIQN